MATSETPQQKWRRTHPEQWAAIQLRVRKKNGSKWQRKYLYGLTEADFAALVAAHEGACAICGTTDPGENRKTLSVDEDKVTGQVRGLLCQRCNKGLGLFKDDPTLLEKAIAYLVRLPRTGS